MQKTNHFFLFHSIVAIQKQILLQTNQKIGEQKNQIPKLKRNIKSSYSTVTDTLLEGENKPFLFFELKVSYCFKPNTYEFNEELINWDYKGFRLGFE